MRYLPTILFGILFSVISISSSAQENHGQTHGLVIETQQTIASFQVEYPRTQAEKARGLMFRTTMADDAGMIFHYKKPADISMWMENTYLSLDMLFIKPLEDNETNPPASINADYKLLGEIVHIAKRTTPLSRATISSGQKVIAVLEIKAGQADSQNIKVGDRVYWNF